MTAVEADARPDTRAGSEGGEKGSYPWPSIARAVVQRLIAGVFVLWAAATLAFLSLHLAPGDTVDLLIGEQVRTPEIVAAVTAEWGLDRPVFVQYIEYLAGLAVGDFGKSYVLHRDVSDVLLSQLLPTVKLTVAALLVSVVVAVSSAVLTAGRRWPRRIASGVELVLVSAPSFWIGIVFLAIFSFQLKIFPVAGDKNLASLVLPALTLGLPIGALLGQVLREGVERSLEEPYAVTVRARGVRDIVLRVRHALRHATLPALTLTGYVVGGLLTGAVIVEQVFGRPGLGAVTVSAVTSKDLPIVLAVALLSAFVFVVVNTIVDLLYRLVDPRLRGQGN
ncbi:peptide/nickel transport system permease protein [Rhodococcus sp. 27YEA15]|uniref:ABC transporter permease n=1 Tax=Rhodococcus sp. 27YEA15 TaxID=3156259 RepID=UPI003C7AF12E